MAAEVGGCADREVYIQRRPTEEEVLNMCLRPHRLERWLSEKYLLKTIHVHLLPTSIALPAPTELDRTTIEPAHWSEEARSQSPD